LRIHQNLIHFIDTVGLSSATEMQFHTGKHQGSTLESRLNQLKKDLLDSRLEKEKQKGLLEMVAGSLDTALICTREEGDIAFLNPSAKKLLGNKSLASFDDLQDVNPVLAGSLGMVTPGYPKVINLDNHVTSIRCFRFLIEKDSYALYTIQNIQREIESHEIESWKKLIRVLTHEIMNSLGPILSLTRSLRKSISSTEKVRSGLETIESTGEGLVRFLDEYKKLYTLPQPEKKRIELSELIEQVRSLFDDEAGKKNASLDTSLPATGINVLADPQQLEQVLLNLLRNALDSLETISQGRILIKAEEKNSRIRIQVEDNGPGIPDTIKDRIFIPFYSTKDHGSGIGLSLSRQIMHNHGGSLTFTSVPGVSTLFTMEF
jgi:nitrogen fixation/metabolism regulation signal transduction histidine kinase